jgi:hypothetical protein
VRPTAIAGFVQKGPFVRGTTVTVQELDDKLVPTGRSYDVATTDDLGGFNVPVNPTSRFVEVVATGYYYDELRDQVSPGLLTLRAISDVATDGKVNVNVLTSISAPLLRDLLNAGQPFANAKRQAESLALDALGFTSTGVTSFEKLDVASSGPQNAILLASSLVIEKYAESLGFGGRAVDPAAVADSGVACRGRSQPVGARQSSGGRLRDGRHHRHRERARELDAPLCRFRAHDRRSTLRELD